jgi:hypothetical protein
MEAGAVNDIAERRFANPVDKPATSASVFARAAWFLADYAELWWDCNFGDGDDAEDEARCNEMAELARRLRELDEGWKARAGRSLTHNAAEIIADMLSDWKLPGAVYWSAQARRWRVVGAEYRPQADDVLVGVYAPGADVSLLREDLDAVDPRTALS